MLLWLMPIARDICLNNIYCPVFRPGNKIGSHLTINRNIGKIIPNAIQTSAVPQGQCTEPEINNAHCPLISKALIIASLIIASFQ